MVQGQVIDGLPQIFWSDATPWREANLWALERATGSEVDIRTVQTDAIAIHAYANWLEETKSDWRSFPRRKADRCLVRYRGALIDARNSGMLAPSTVSQRMRVAISFYRWLRDMRLFSSEWPIWQEHRVGIRLVDATGFERTIAVNSTDLRIPNRAARGERLEDGLLPITSVDRDAALTFARNHASQELFLMLTLGFFSGMRLGTITDLKVRTLTNAVRDPVAPNLFKIAVGPGADPPVATKFGVTGQIWITGVLLDTLLHYAHSERRLKREIKAVAERKDLIFLTRFGNPYAQRGSDKSVAVNVEMHAFKRLAVTRGLSAMRDFRFHQTRCTFATELARIAIKAGGSIGAVAIVKEALLLAPTGN
ncbi:site-specific integrase [Variovorax sp. V118]